MLKQIIFSALIICIGLYVPECSGMKHLPSKSVTLSKEQAMGLAQVIIGCGGIALGGTINIFNIIANTRAQEVKTIQYCWTHKLFYPKNCPECNADAAACLVKVSSSILQNGLNRLRGYTTNQ
jgi:hypothetical protein